MKLAPLRSAIVLSIVLVGCTSTSSSHSNPTTAKAGQNLHFTFSPPKSGLKLFTVDVHFFAGSVKGYSPVVSQLLISQHSQQWVATFKVPKTVCQSTQVTSGSAKESAAINIRESWSYKDPPGNSQITTRSQNISITSGVACQGYQSPTQ